MTQDTFFDRPDSYYFVPDPDAAAQYCRAQWPQETAHIFRIADDACVNRFLFDLNWDMERTYEPVQFDGKIDWELKPKGDPEFVWQFNRHRFFICLGQAYRLSGDERYASAFVRLAEDWMARVALNERTQTGPWRILETGLRAETWTKAIRYFKGSSALTEAFMDHFADCLCRHADRLVEKGGDERLQSNWSVLENSGLFELAMGLPRGEKTQLWAETALARLEKAVRMQVYEDGSQWEQSPMYHNEVLHCLCCVLYLARANRVQLPEGFEARVHAMARVNLLWRKPDGSQFAQGDSDVTDLRDMLSMGAYLFADGELKYAGFPQLDFESAWDFGPDACRAYEALAAREPSFASAVLCDSGNYYLRTDWSAKANLLHFTCGAMSTGHCHGDKMHVDLVVNGEDVLIDSGRGTYMNVPLRFALKGNEGHNTTTVDGEPFTTFSDSWYTERLSLPVNRAYFAGKTAEYVQGGHLGYMDRGVFVNRRCIWIKPDIYLLCDEFYGKGAHVFRQFFHFAPDGKLSLQGNSAVFEGKTNQARFVFLPAGLKLVPGEGECSQHYNQTVKNRTLCAILNGNNFASMITLISGGEKGRAEEVQASLIDVYSHSSGEKLPDSVAQALELTCGTRRYVVTICHDEAFHGSDALSAGGCLAGGNVCVFDRSGLAEDERLYGGEVLHV